MSGQNEQKQVNLWFVWNYEREQQRLDRLSAAGLHLTKPGKFWSSYTQDDARRFTYRLDYQPALQNAPARRDYLDLYQAAGWAHIGDCMHWHYFRREWSPDKPAEIYTDRDSLKWLYRRIRRVLGVVFIAELPALLINIININLLTQRGKLPLWPITATIVLLVAVMLLLGYGFLAMTRKIRAIDNG